MSFRAADADVFLADGETVVISGVTYHGTLRVADLVEQDGGGGAVQVRRRVVRVKSTVAALLNHGSTLTVDGTSYTCDDKALVDDGLFSDVILSGGAL